jgi:predicted DNA-binding transcriptional regulator YafY
MRASRLLSILLLLQTRGRMTAQALAEAFETSVRTIYRDIDQLSAAGVPVYAERGRDGGFQLIEGYRTRLTGLSPDEAETLFLYGLPGPAADLGLGDALAAAQLKLLAALPVEGASRAARVGGRFHLDPVSWYRGAEAADVLPALAGAVWNARRARILYQSWSGRVEREIEPLGLALKAGVWYAVAQVGTAEGVGALRTYRVAAIETLTVLDEVFERPADFDLAAYWSAWVADFEARIFQGEAVLRLSPRGLERLSALALSPTVAAMAARTRSAAGADGWVRVTIPVEGIENAAAEVLKLGAEAEVLAPPALRRRVGEIIAALGRFYAAGGDSALAMAADPGL